MNPAPRRRGATRSRRLGHTCVEPLENRALLSASISVGNIDAGTTSHPVTVVYSDPDGVNTATIDATDLTVNGSQGAGSVEVVSIAEPGTSVEVRYAVT